MNFDFTAFGGTLAIGFAGIISLWWILYSVKFISIPPLSTLKKEHAGRIAILTVASIGFGISIDSLSDDLADTALAVPYKLFWGDDLDHKLEVLYPQAQIKPPNTEQASARRKEALEVHPYWEPTLLGRQIANARLLSTSAEPTLRQLARNFEDHIIADRRVYVNTQASPPTRPPYDKESLLKLVRPAYFAAKARVMSESTLAEEMRQIQQRIVFGRSLCVVGVLALTGALLATLLNLIKIILNLIKIFWAWYCRTPAKPAAWAQLPRNTLTTLLTAATTLPTAAMYTMGGFIFSEQEDEYDKRVFGYYYNLLPDTANTSPNAINLRSCPSSSIGVLA